MKREGCPCVTGYRYIKNKDGTELCDIDHGSNAFNDVVEYVIKKHGFEDLYSIYDYGDDENAAHMVRPCPSGDEDCLEVLKIIPRCYSKQDMKERQNFQLPDWDEDKNLPLTRQLMREGVLRG
jgi:hypothetical protein